MITKILVTVGVLVLMGVVGVVSFYYGVQYGNEQAVNIRLEFFRERLAQQGASGIQPSETAQTQNPRGQGAQTGQAAQAGLAGQFGRVAANGTVKSVSGNKIEVTTQSGGTVTVTVESSTQILKTISIQSTDIQPGQRITVTSDQTGNNVTARVIQIRDAN